MTDTQHDLGAPQEVRELRRRRWTIVAFLAVLAFINYGDRAAFGVAAKPIMDDFGFSAAAFGAISAAFTLGYIPANLLGGIAGDRFGAVRVLRFTVLIWSLVVGSLAFAFNYATFFANRMLFGLAEGPNFALDTKLISQWTTPEQRGRALSGVTVGIPLGTAVAAPLVGLLVAATGWRTSFIILGAVGLIWIAASWPWLKEPSAFGTAPEDETDRRAASTVVEKAKVPWRVVLSTADIWAVVVAGFCGAYLNFMLITWLPEYFRLSLGFSLKSSALASAAPWAGAAAGIVLSGMLSDRILRRTGSVRWARSGILGIGLLCSAVCLTLTSQTTTVWLSVALMTLATFFAYPSVTNLLFGIAASIVPVGSVASVTGLVVGLASFGGLVGPVLTGVMVDASGGFGAALLTAAAVTAVGGLVAVFGVRGNQLSGESPR